MTHDLDLNGIVPIVVTPFDSRNRIHVPSLHQLVDDYCANGVAGVVVPAVASEVDKLTPAECQHLIRETVLATSGRVPVIGGILADTGPAAARAAENALMAGVSGLLCRAPADIASDADSIRRYFREVGKVGTNLIIQDLAWNDYGMELSLIFELCAIVDGLRAFKIEVPQTGYKASQIIHETCGSIDIWSGWAMPQMIETLDRGVNTYNPSAYNAPFVRVFQLYRRGDRRAAMQAFERLLPYLAWSRQHIDINLQLLKRYCVRKGLFATEAMRSPVVCYDKHHERYGDDLITRMLEWEQDDEKE